MTTRAITKRSLPGENRFKLGLFSFNNYGGLTNTLAPERWEATWPNMVALSKAGEAAGFEFLLPLAGWLGHDGEAETDGHFHETLTWAAGLLAETERIHVFATVHVPFVHPVFAAKQAVTCDHIGEGRLGLNVVAGYNIDEFALFGVPYEEHDRRYAYLEEWLELVVRMWTEATPFAFKGKFFDLRGVVSQPKPFGSERPIVVSAGSSPTGRSFALRNADALFMVIPDIETLADELTVVRGAMGKREIDIYASGHVFCRKTKMETREYYDYLIHERGDWSAGRYLLKAYEEIKSVPPEVLAQPQFLERLMSGYGTFPIVGDPDDVVATLKRLNQAGIDGMAIALPSYLDDFPIIRDEVLPRMQAAGLRA